MNDLFLLSKDSITILILMPYITQTLRNLILLIENALNTTLYIAKIINKNLEILWSLMVFHISLYVEEFDHIFYKHIHTSGLMYPYRNFSIMKCHSSIPWCTKLVMTAILIRMNNMSWLHVWWYCKIIVHCELLQIWWND